METDLLHVECKLLALAELFGDQRRPEGIPAKEKWPDIAFGRRLILESLADEVRAISLSSLRKVGSP